MSCGRHKSPQLGSHFLVSCGSFATMCHNSPTTHHNTMWWILVSCGKLSSCRNQRGGSCPGDFSFFCICMLHKTHSRRLRAALPSAFAAFELSGATFSMLAANNKIQPRPKVTTPHTGTKTRCATATRCGLNLLWFRKHRFDLRTISILLENPVNSENCSNFRAPHCCTQYQAKPYVSTFLV